MGNAFRPISALIEADFPWREASPKVLRHPAVHEPQDSRIVFHETVNYWQQLGQGFMAKIVQEDWIRLQRFEKENALEDPGPYRLEFVQQHIGSGFSAHDLQESLARFWDVHVIGPHRLLEMDFVDPRRSFDEFFKEQYFAFKKKGMIVHPEHGGYSDLAFDMAMEASAGSYAKPYQYVRERFNPVVTGTVFPLAGHFALQTEKPIDVFLKVIDAVAPYLEQLPRGRAIHDLWKACYPLIRDQTLRVAHQIGIGALKLTAASIRNSPLRDHPVYRWIFFELERGRRVLEDTPFASELAQTFGHVPDGLRGVLAIDFCLSCPGDTTNRSFLVEWLAPPCVRFPDGRSWLLTELYRRELVPEIDDAERQLSEERLQVADNVVNIQERWLAFRRSARGY
jgi:hypothetical protein